jgi:tRNA threonylcarbamoyladenosine biosynthesis protein TsaE
MAAERRLESQAPAATEALGEALGAQLAAGDVVAIDGELGTGKTCLVRGLARGLGVTDGVTSPSFTLMHTYPGRLPVHHLDAWMQERGEAFLADGGAEWLRADGVALVEWAERVAAWLPVPRVQLLLAHGGGDRRTLRLGVLQGPEVQPRGERLEAALWALELPPGLREVP